MCMGGGKAPPPAPTPAPAPPPPPEAPVAPIIDGQTSSDKAVVAANSAGRGSLRIDRSTSGSTSGGSGLNIPTA